MYALCCLGTSFIYGGFQHCHWHLPGWLKSYKVRLALVNLPTPKSTAQLFFLVMRCFGTYLAKGAQSRIQRVWRKDRNQIGPTDPTHRVQLQRSNESDGFGLLLGGHRSIDGLIIVEVHDDSPVGTWNENSTAFHVEVGQVVLEVNGFSKFEDMLEQFRNGKSVDMVISNKLSADHRVILKSCWELQSRTRFVDKLLETRNGECQHGEACSICHEEMLANGCEAKLPCGHCFHKACVKRWLVAGHLRCPLCNSDFGSDHVQLGQSD